MFEVCDDGRGNLAIIKLKKNCSTFFVIYLCTYSEMSRLTVVVSAVIHWYCERMGLSKDQVIKEVDWDFF